MIEGIYAQGWTRRIALRICHAQCGDMRIDDNIVICEIAGEQIELRRGTWVALGQRRGLGNLWLGKCQQDQQGGKPPPALFGASVATVLRPITGGVTEYWLVCIVY